VFFNIHNNNNNAIITNRVKFDLAPQKCEQNILYL